MTLNDCFPLEDVTSLIFDLSMVNGPVSLTMIPFWESYTLNPESHRSVVTAAIFDSSCI